MDVAKDFDMDNGSNSLLPQIVPECLMIEPTETESKETLDEFATNFIKVLQTDAETLHESPTTTPVRRVDEVYAARNLF